MTRPSIWSTVGGYRSSSPFARNGDAFCKLVGAKETTDEVTWDGARISARHPDLEDADHTRHPSRAPPLQSQNKHASLSPQGLSHPTRLPVLAHPRQAAKSGLATDDDQGLPAIHSDRTADGSPSPILQRHRRGPTAARRDSRCHGASGLAVTDRHGVLAPTRGLHAPPGPDSGHPTETPYAGRGQRPQPLGARGTRTMWRPRVGARGLTVVPHSGRACDGGPLAG